MEPIRTMFLVDDSASRAASRRLSFLRCRSSRRKVRLILLLTASMIQMYTRVPRSVWSFRRSSTWWEDIVCGSFSHRDWIENFRVSRETFLYICDQLKGAVGRKDTRFRKAVSVRQRVAITLCILASPCEYGTVSHLFGLARCTVCCIVKDTCRAIVTVLLPKYVKFPVADKLKETVKGFLDKWGIPQCAGSIDGSHIPVLPPTMNHTDYYNRKGFYSVNVQAVVDHNLLFTDLYIGWPGNVHDARVLVNSALYSRCSSKEWLKGDTVRVGNSQLPTFLIGDSAYPLLPWLLKPFSMVMNLTMSGCKSVKVMPRLEPSQIQVMLRQQVAVQMVKKFVKFLLTTLNRTLCDIFVNNYYNVVD